MMGNCGRSGMYVTSWSMWFIHNVEFSSFPDKQDNRELHYAIGKEGRRSTVGNVIKFQQIHRLAHLHIRNY